jgi:hypothetical protein
VLFRVPLFEVALIPGTLGGPDLSHLPSSLQCLPAGNGPSQRRPRTHHWRRRRTRGAAWTTVSCPSEAPAGKRGCNTEPGNLSGPGRGPGDTAGVRSFNGSCEALESPGWTGPNLGGIIRLCLLPGVKSPATLSQTDSLSDMKRETLMIRETSIWRC